MSRDFDRSHVEEEVLDGQTRRPSPGKVSLTSKISADAPAPAGQTAARPSGLVQMQRAPGSDGGFGGAASAEMSTVGLHGGSDAQHAGAAIADKGAGAPLPSGLASQFGGAYDTSLGDVRIHTDGNASAAASKTGARAFTYGADIFFGSGQYNPGSPEGNQLIGHELAHVAQQGASPQAKGEHGDKLIVGQVGDAQEREADSAADTALAGGKASLKKAGPALRFDKQGGMGRGGHAQTTEEALMSGVHALNATEANRARMLNWMQDYNQVFQPKSQVFHLVTPLKPIMELLAIKEFGIGIDWAKMGTYDPVRHIDRPDQLKGTDVLAQGPIRYDGLNDDDVSKKGDLPLAGSKSDVYSNIDPRYDPKNLPGYAEKDDPKTKAVENYNNDDDKAYSVNSTGIPAFVAASKKQCRGEFMEAARRGTKGAKEGDWDAKKDHGKALTGPELFSAAAHTLQDYPTHCNYVEVGLNILIRSGECAVASGPEGKGRTKLGKKETLDTGIHELGEKGKENRHVKNYTISVPVKDKDGNAKKDKDGNVITEEREVMTSGGFSLIDTADSIVAGLKDVVDGIDPMADEGGLGDAVLDYIDKSGGSSTDFSNLGSMVKGTAKVINALATLIPKAGSAVISGAGTVIKGASSVAAAPTDVASFGLGLLGDAADYVGADAVADIADSAKSGVEAVGGGIRGAGSAVDDKAKEISKALDDVVAQMDKFVADINDQHTLVRLKHWMKEGMEHTIDAMINTVGKLPKPVGPKAKKHLKALRKNLKSAIKHIIALAWAKAKADALGLIEDANQGLAKMRAAEDKAAATAKKKDPTRSKKLSDPGHANISKDHADFWIEEDGEPTGGEQKFKVRETEKKVLDRKTGEYRDPKELEESDWVKDLAERYGYDASVPKEKKKNIEEDYKPETLMQALSPLAHGLGVTMTQRVKKAVDLAWTKVNDEQDATTEVEAVGTALDEVWTHPADNRDLWVGMATKFLQHPQFGPAFLRMMRPKDKK